MSSLREVKGFDGPTVAARCKSLIRELDRIPDPERLDQLRPQCAELAAGVRDQGRGFNRGEDCIQLSLRLFDLIESGDARSTLALREYLQKLLERFELKQINSSPQSKIEFILDRVGDRHFDDLAASIGASKVNMQRWARGGGARYEIENTLRMIASTLYYARQSIGDGEELWDWLESSKMPMDNGETETPLRWITTRRLGEVVVRQAEELAIEARADALCAAAAEEERQSQAASEGAGDQADSALADLLA